MRIVEMPEKEKGVPCEVQRRIRRLFLSLSLSLFKSAKLCVLKAIGVEEQDGKVIF